MTKRSQNDLTEFSHRLAKIKFVIFEVAMSIVFLVWVFDKVKHDVFPPEPPQYEQPLVPSRIP